MTRRRIFPAFALALAVSFSGCDLAVENLNAPDRARALAAPEDVETLISSSYQKVWEIGHYWNNANFAFGHMASRHTATWGNMGMNDLGREPREALPNTPSYRWAYVFEANWGDAYGGISAASDGLRALDAGLNIGDGGERNERARVFAKSTIAILTCLLGLWYDKAYLIDETIDLGGELVTTDYSGVIQSGLMKLDEAASMARSAAAFTLEANWVNGNPWSNEQLAAYLVGWKARCRANAPRSDAEAASTDWSAVSADAMNGIRDVVITSSHFDSDDPWYDGVKILMQENNTWHRMHMDWVGMADQSGQYQDWLTFPTEQRTARNMSFGDDMRFPTENVNGALGMSVSPTVASTGPRARYNATVIFRPERGTYRQSHYGDSRYDAYTLSCWFCQPDGFPLETMTSMEMDHYIAEGAYRMGNFGAAADIINVTRMQAGLPPAPSNPTDAVPMNASGGCTPKKRYDVQGRCGNLRDAMIFEHFQNVFNVYGGLEFWHGRRNDLLPTMTALHLPIPAADLEVLQQEIYTFGGGGDDSAPSPIPPSVIPGDLTSALERVSWTLDRFQEQQKASIRAQKADLVVR